MQYMDSSSGRVITQLAQKVKHEWSNSIMVVQHCQSASSEQISHIVSDLLQLFALHQDYDTPPIAMRIILTLQSVRGFGHNVCCGLTFLKPFVCYCYTIIFATS